MDAQIFLEEPTAFVVALAPSMCQALRPLARQEGFRVEAFASMDGYLAAADASRAGCVLLDLEAHAAQGGEALPTLVRKHVHLPLIAVLQCPEIRAVVAAMRNGAFGVLSQACQEAELAEAVHEAFRWDAENHAHVLQWLKLQRRAARLTEGERAVLEMLSQGQPNREIADELGLSVRAVEARRARLMGKLRARSLADLLAQTFGGKCPMSPLPGCGLLRCHC